MFYRSVFDLRPVELFLNGRLTVSKFGAKPYRPIDRVLASYAIAIAHPRGVGHQYRAAILSAGGEDWLLRQSISHLFGEIFPGQHQRIERMVTASLEAELHYTAGGDDVLLALPAELVALSKRYENQAMGPVMLFYQRRMRRRVH